jgi:hypothetical protein
MAYQTPEVEAIVSQNLLLRGELNTWKEAALSTVDTLQARATKLQSTVSRVRGERNELRGSVNLLKTIALATTLAAGVTGAVVSRVMAPVTTVTAILDKVEKSQKIETPFKSNRKKLKVAEEHVIIEKFRDRPGDEFKVEKPARPWAETGDAALLFGASIGFQEAAKYGVLLDARFGVGLGLHALGSVDTKRNRKRERPPPIAEAQANVDDLASITDSHTTPTDVVDIFSQGAQETSQVNLETQAFQKFYNQISVPYAV